MRNKQPCIEGRIENLHVRVLRQEIETLVLFEIGGVRFRMRCRAFSFKQGDLVRVKYCKQGYLGSLVALEVERRRTPLEYARDFALSALDAAKRALSLAWDVLITFGLIFFATTVFYAIYFASKKDAFSNLGDFFYTCAGLALVAMIILAHIYSIIRAIERRAPRLTQLAFSLAERLLSLARLFWAVLLFCIAVIAVLLWIYMTFIEGKTTSLSDFFYSCVVLTLVCMICLICSTCMQKLSSWRKRRKK
ncbi:hypothetical protein [uncultured Campylobacter sp.]|uniref:hypothetical protein n=1 Tax=uncultured Campylobacter sp. TaxID=218934 RepID=UPI00260AA21A|nr:hypothetical protein [uncultured Campylobacter sp.]